MFDRMTKLIEQQNADGAIRHAEFDPPESTLTSLSDEARAQLISFIDETTPDRHRVQMADGGSAIVYFDTRGRATSGVLTDLSDDELTWIAQSRNWKGFSLPPTGDAGYRPPVQESVESVSLEQKKGEDYWYVKKGGKRVGAVSMDSDGGFDGSREAGGFKKGFKTKDEAADWVGGSGSVDESAGFKLTPKSRTAMEKFIYARFPNDQRMKSGGRMKIMFSGNTATAAGVQTNTVLFLDTMECSAIAAVAKLLGYTGAIEKVEEASFSQATKTFKPGTYLHMKTQTWEGWFYPLEDQKNGGLAGLQSDIKDSGRFGKPVKKSLPSGHRQSWKEETPPSDVRSKFESHPDFVGPTNEDTMVERTSDPVRRARDYMDPTIQIFSVDTKEMSQEEFEKWLSSRGIRAQVKKSGREYTAYTESKKEI